jgi:hypothetical protein
MVTLSVGSPKVEIKCHRILLAYYSSFFERMLFGHFAESQQDHIDLPDHCPSHIQAFATWTYTGVIDWELLQSTSTEADPLIHEKLWVLGDKIESPKFLNCVTQLLFSKYKEARVPIEAIDYIYENTLSKSLLRKLLIRSVTSEGPLHRNAGLDKGTQWKKLVFSGGQFVLDVVLSGGFCLWNDFMSPRSQQHDYLSSVKYNARKWREGEII